MKTFEVSASLKSITPGLEVDPDFVEIVITSPVIIDYSKGKNLIESLYPGVSAYDIETQEID